MIIIDVGFDDDDNNNNDDDEEDDNDDDDKNKILEEINNQKPAKNIEIDESLFNLEDIQDELENLDI